MSQSYIKYSDFVQSGTQVSVSTSTVIPFYYENWSYGGSYTGTVYFPDKPKVIVTNYNNSSNQYIQGGQKTDCATNGSSVIAFPYAFANTPRMSLTYVGGESSTVIAQSVSSGSFILNSGVAGTVDWMAFDPSSAPVNMAVTATSTTSFIIACSRSSTIDWVAINTQV